MNISRIDDTSAFVEKRFDLSRRFWISLLLTLVLAVLSFGETIPRVNFDWLVAPDRTSWLELVLGEDFSPTFKHSALQWLQWMICTPIVFWGAWPLWCKAIRSNHSSLRSGYRFFMFVVSIIYGVSLLALIAPDCFPDNYRNRFDEVPVYFESAAFLITLLLYLQHRHLSRSLA